MITIFSTTKAFKGISAIHQMNAIQSWMSHGPVQILLYGRSEGIEMAEKFEQVQVIDKVEANEAGVPFINFMFAHTSQIAKSDICCFLNSDIIITKGFYDTALNIHKKVEKKYLIVGQRTNGKIDDSINFNNHWEREFIQRHGSSFQLHVPLGSDYFIFPKNQYSIDNIPPMLVGRPGWDLWMIRDSRRKQYQTIDATLTAVIYHPFHEYGHKSKVESQHAKEESHNYFFLPDGEKYNYTIYACNKRWWLGILWPAFARFNIYHYSWIQSTLNKEGTFKKKFFEIALMIINKIRSSF